MKIYKITIDIKDEGLRLDQFLATTAEIKTRSQALKIIQKNGVLSGKTSLKPSHKLKAGEILTIHLPDVISKKLEIYDIAINVVYEDEDILVVNKPAGLVVHPAPGHPSDTLVNALFTHTKLSPGSNSLRPGIVHRLDKDSSGLLVLAKNKEAETSLIEQFKQKSVRRIYWALSLKTPPALETTLESYIKRHPRLRQKFISIKNYQAGSKKAVTHYKVVKTHGNGISWLECRLETGRTHQIRVHLKSIACPIVGDFFYDEQQNVKSKSLKSKVDFLGRIALHARALSFQHPATNQRMDFECDWPEDLKEMLIELNFIKK